MATEDGTELEGEPQDGQVIDASDDGDAGEGEGQRAADAGDGDGKPNRRERQRQRQKEHEQRIAEQASAPLKAQLEMLQNQQNQQNQLIRDLLAQRQAQPAAAPTTPAVDPIKKAVERMKNRAALIRDEDPATAEKFFEEQAMIIREAAKEEAEATRKSLLEEMRRSRPEVDPTEAVYYGMAQWLQDAERKRDVLSEMNRIAHREQKDLRNPVVKDAVVRRAIARVGQDWDLPVHGITPAAPALPAGRQSAVDGDGSRTITAAAGGGGNGLQGLRWTPQARANYEYLREQGIVKNEKEFLDEVVQPGMTTGKRRANV